MVDAFGCEIFYLAPTNYKVQTREVTCKGESNGEIILTALDYKYNYTVQLTGRDKSIEVELNMDSGLQKVVSGLSPGKYNVCFLVQGVADYKSCFEVAILEPSALGVISSLNKKDNTLKLELSGGKNYVLSLNGDQIITSQKVLSLPLKPGSNQLKISTDVSCQGVYFEEIFVTEKVIVYPNPTKGNIQIFVGGQEDVVDIRISDILGNNIYLGKVKVPNNRVVEADISNAKVGIYLIEIKGKSFVQYDKIIKQ
jgi:hypothetical protein